MEEIKKYEPLWGEWTIKRKLEENRFGAVYEAESKLFGNKNTCAVKLISLKNTVLLSEVRERKNLSTEELKRLKIEEARKSVWEIILMKKFQEENHIVNIYDYEIFPDQRKTDIVMRMELLTNLTNYIDKNKKSGGELKQFVIKLGIDICKALEKCEKENIIHRDINPENIFIDKNEKFKLGNFGMNYKTGCCTSARLFTAGTPLYMSPEAFDYLREVDNRMDIYSLGIVMYQLLNDGNIPFIKAEEPYALDNAIERRLKGEKILPPQNENGQLWEVIQKACQFKKEDRYQNASEMRTDLEKLQSGKNIKTANSLKIEQIKNEITVLKQDIFELKNMEIEKINIETEKMQKDLSLAQSKQKKLEIENEKLCIRLENLKSSKEELEQQTSKLNRKNIELQKENNELLNSKSVLNYILEGNTISFGRYPQDESGIVKPIEWVVLKTEKDKVLLLSRYILDKRPYNKKDENVTWETSDIRRWLNEDFYKIAFNSMEQKKISDTLVRTENNSRYGTGGGNDTKDKVFLLSIEEVEEVFGDNIYEKGNIMCDIVDAIIQSFEAREIGSREEDDRRLLEILKNINVSINTKMEFVKTTEYVQKDIKYPYLDWWLRSPGERSNETVAVNGFGSIDKEGRSITINDIGVCPAMWVKF